MPQWEPGQSGNPRGRPKGRTIAGAIREILDRGEDLDGKPLEGGKTLRDVLAETLLRVALGGDVKALRDVLAWHDGRPRQVTPERSGSTVRDAAIARLRASIEGTDVSDTDTDTDRGRGDRSGA